MTVVLTIRDVPDEVRDALATEARGHGQSLQAFLLGVLRRQAAFDRNRQMLAEVERDLSEGGAGEDAPDAAELLAEARGERGRSGPPGTSSRTRRTAVIDDRPTSR